MSKLKVFLAKDLKTELSSSRAVVFFSTAFVLAFLAEIVVQSAFIPPESRQKLLLPFIWLVFFVCQLFQAPKMFEPERETRVNQGIRLSGVCLSTVFVSKLLVYSLLNLILLGFISLLIKFFWSDQSVVLMDLLKIIILTGVPVIISSTSIVTLTGATSLTDNNSALLTPITIMPLLIPLFVIAIEFSYNILLQREVITSIAIGCLLAVFYLALSLFLFPYIYTNR